MNTNEIKEELSTAKSAFLSKPLNLSVRHALWIAVGILIAAFIAISIAFWFGTIKKAEWSDSEYLRKREQRLNMASEAEGRAKLHIENAEKLALQNEAEKKANEQQAANRSREDQVLINNRKQAEKVAEQNAQKIEKARKDKNEKIIKDGSDYDRQLNGLCDDLKSSGTEALSVCR